MNKYEEETDKGRGSDMDDTEMDKVEKETRRVGVENMADQIDKEMTWKGHLGATLWQGNCWRSSSNKHNWECLTQSFSI